MLKETVKYKDFDGNAVEDVFYFNLTQTEIIELEVGYEAGLEAFILRIVEAGDRETLIAEFKRLLLSAVGERSEDGKRFYKEDAVRKDFERSAAFDYMFIRMATDEEYASRILLGMLPEEVREAAARPQDKPLAPPPVPSTA